MTVTGLLKFVEAIVAAVSETGEKVLRREKARSKTGF